jgi:hypothetical protein
VQRVAQLHAGIADRDDDLLCEHRVDEDQDLADPGVAQRPDRVTD